MIRVTANISVCAATMPSIGPAANQRKRLALRASMASDDKGDLLLLSFAGLQFADERQHVLAEAPHLAARGPTGEDEFADAGLLVLDEVLRHLAVAADHAQRRAAAIGHRARPQHRRQPVVGRTFGEAKRGPYRFGVAVLD